MGGLALVEFITDPTSSELSATKYSKAGGECLVFILALTWTITYFTQRDIISDNPLRDRLGYNNVCVGLDTKPASYVAALLWPFLSYFNIRAAWVTAITELTLDEKHSSTASKCITVLSSCVSLVSTCILAVLFLFPPVPDAQAVWIHTGIYVQFIIGRLFGIAVLYYRNYLDGSHEELDNTSQASWIFLHVYAAVSLVLPVIFYINYSWYDITRKEGQSPDERPIPATVTMVLDYTWLACVGLTTKFLPPQSTLHLKRQESLRQILKPGDNA